MEEDSIETFFWSLIEDGDQRKMLRLISKDLSELQIIERLLED